MGSDGKVRVLQSEQGFTLLEVLVASVLLATVMLVVASSISTASRSGEISQRRSDELKGLERVWVLIENDLRNVVAVTRQIPFSEPLPAIQIDESGDEFTLRFIRAGNANPLLLPRSEVLRVAYRLDEESVLWRDSWVDSSRPEEEYAQTQELLAEVEEFTVKALLRPPKGRSFTQGPWLENWPESNDPRQLTEIPLALDIVMKTKSMGELRRLITLARGGVATPPNGPPP